MESTYRLQIDTWLEFMCHSADARGFQNQSVAGGTKEEAVFADLAEQGTQQPKERGDLKEQACTPA